MNYKDCITVEPNKRGGKPCIRGLRITVYEVLEYLASDMTEEEILADFPDLTKEDLEAAIAFAADRERRLMEVPLAAWVSYKLPLALASGQGLEWRPGFSPTVERSFSLLLQPKKRWAKAPKLFHLPTIS